MHQFKKIIKRYGIGTSIIVLLWLALLNKNHYLPLDTRVFYAAFMVAIMVTAFRVSRVLYEKIRKNELHWSSLLLLQLGLSGLSAVFGFLFLDIEFMAKEERESYAQVVFFDVVPVLPITITMIFSWAFYLFAKNKENELAISKLITLNKESELSELKKQLNPHFLFNALSNIYSIAYLKDERTPKKIMQLSKMLRYVIYETDVQFIPLSKEIEYLEYYIDFQKFKIKKTQEITFDYSSVNQELEIAPLLLLPFIENAFKHSQVITEPAAWVKVKLVTKGPIINFTVENSISTKKQPEILSNEGIGLENIKKRVELVYKGKAELQITEKDVFSIHLIINTDE